MCHPRPSDFIHLTAVYAFGQAVPVPNTGPWKLLRFQELDIFFFQVPPVSDSRWHLSFHGTYLSQRSALDVHPRRHR